MVQESEEIVWNWRMRWGVVAFPRRILSACAPAQLNKGGGFQQLAGPARGSLGWHSQIPKGCGGGGGTQMRGKAKGVVTATYITQSLSLEGAATVDLM